MTDMTYKEPEPIQLSALEHYAYCPRQCALIHVEHVWDENIYTMRGRDVHERVDEASSHEAADVRVERALPIWSRRLNITGRADVVEFHGNVPYPVEYKSGRRRRVHSEALQLCAQAMCLEEMLDTTIEKGALYWHGSRERQEVFFTADLRLKVEATTLEVHALIAKNQLPPPLNDSRCDDCSLREACLPLVVGAAGGYRRMIEDLFDANKQRDERPG
jgi:CRISPR-associated exonuclease Cas4